MSDLAPVERHALLDLAPWIGQRAESFKFERIDRHFNHLGWLHPSSTDPCSISVDTRARVTRKLTGMKLSEADWHNVNTLSDLVRVYHILEDGTVNTMGVFEFDDSHEHQHSQESTLEVDLFDLSSTLDDAIPEPLSIPRGSALRPFLVALLESKGILHHRVSLFPETAGDHLNWPAGDSALDIARKLAQLGAQLPPYFANDGYLTVRPPPPMTAGLGHDYTGRNPRTLPDQTVKNQRLGKAPNAFLVIGIGGQANSVSAIEYVDPELPHSRENRGVTVTKVIREQGIETSDQARQVARTLAQQDPRQYATMRFVSVVDSRHDTFDLVDIEHDTWLEIAHAAMLAPGGTHTHEIVKSLSLGESVGA